MLAESLSENHRVLGDTAGGLGFLAGRGGGLTVNSWAPGVGGVRKEGEGEGKGKGEAVAERYRKTRC
jgi:hypothetical protein